MLVARAAQYRVGDDIRVEGREPPNQERANQVVEVPVDRVLREAEALPDLGGVPELPVQRRQHAEEPERDPGLGRKAPLREVALRKEGQVVPLPGCTRSSHSRSRRRRSVSSSRSK